MMSAGLVTWLRLPSSEITLPIEPFISIGGGILIALVTGGFGLLTVWLNKRLNRLDTQEGVGPSVSKSLARIERDLGGLRADHRGTNSRLDNLTERFNSHIDKEN